MSAMKRSIDDLLARLTVDEMIGMMYGGNGMHTLTPFTYPLWDFHTRGVPRLRIPAFRFTDGPKGINLNHSTCFPVAMARGASFDAELEERVGRAMGIEARHQGANATGSTCINIVRHPGWGRSQETFGSDPFHMAAMGAAHLRGLKENVMPVVKHYACNSIENSRFKVSVNIDERTLREIYLPHFKACVDEGAASIMSAYNRVNGTYCGENPHLLTTILREEWGFEGFVISDFVLGCRSTVPSLKAGLDIEMPLGWYYRKWRFKRALRKGNITRADLERSVRRILLKMEEFGLFQSFTSYPERYVACKEHTALALESARKGIVLLKNEGNILPLKKEKLKKIAVVGRHAEEAVLGDIASSAVRPPWKISLLEGLKERSGGDIEIRYARGIGEARKIAPGAGAVIILVSLSWRNEGENIPFAGGDRLNLELPDKYVRLIRDVSKLNPNCIVVLQGGSAVCVDEWIDGVPALLMAWYPGMQGGRAIADVLFGEYNPAGRLPLTVPKNTAQLPPLDTKSSEVIYDYWHDYRYFDHHRIVPRYHFGFGLSYTRFVYSGLSIDRKRISEKGGLTVRVRVRNAGSMDGEEVVQLYVGYAGSKISPRSEKELKGFRRIFIRKGKETTITFKIKASGLAWYNAEHRRWEVEMMKYRVFSGPSSGELPVWKDFIVGK